MESTEARLPIMITKEEKGVKASSSANGECTGGKAAVVSAHEYAANELRSGNSNGNGMHGYSVLVSDEHYKHSLGIVRQLGRMGARVSMVAASKRSLACQSRYCLEVIAAGGATVEALTEATLNAAKSKHFDLVIPVSYAMTRAMARRREELPANTRLELASSLAIEQAADKAEMMKLARKVGVSTPQTFVESDVFGRLQELTFPVVIKPSKESPGRSPVRYAQSEEELKNILPESRGTNGSPGGEELLVQEFIPGEGYGFFATYQDGICKRVFMHRRVREYPASGGISTCAESFYDAELERCGRQMLDALQWHGVAMVEFRRDNRDGQYKLMEVNPKFWGSLDLSLAAGADFPGDLCRMAGGKTLSFCDEYIRGLRFHWPLSGHGELFHLWTRPVSGLEMAIDFVNPRVKSNVWLNDFRPNLQELRGIATQLFRVKRG